MGPPQATAMGGPAGRSPPVKAQARVRARPAGSGAGYGAPASDGDGGSGGAKPPGLNMTGEALLLATTTERPKDDAAVRLGALFDAHQPRLFRLARRLAGSAEDARDLVQETFLRAARSPESVPDGSAHEEAWLVRVLINICRDRWRQVAVRRSISPHSTLLHRRPIRSRR